MSKYKAKMKYQKSKIQIKCQIESASPSLRDPHGSDRNDEGRDKKYSPSPYPSPLEGEGKTIRRFMNKRLVTLISIGIIQFSSAQDRSNVAKIIEKVIYGKLSDTVNIKDHRGIKHNVFVKDGDIFYFIPKSDTANLSCTEAKSCNPYLICVDDTLSLFWKEETENWVNVFYRRRFILAPIHQWTRPICVYSVSVKGKQTQ